MIDLMKISTVQVNRRAIGTWANGHFVKGALTQTDNVECNIQPLSGNELLQVPESDRTREQKWFTSEFEPKLNDVLVWNTFKYEVQMVEDFSEYCTDHWRARIAKLDNQSEPL